MCIESNSRHSDCNSGSSRISPSTNNHNGMSMVTPRKSLLAMNTSHPNNNIISSVITMRTPTTTPTSIATSYSQLSPSPSSASLRSTIRRKLKLKDDFVCYKVSIAIFLLCCTIANCFYMISLLDGYASVTKSTTPDYLRNLRMGNTSSNTIGTSDSLQTVEHFSTEDMKKHRNQLLKDVPHLLEALDAVQKNSEQNMVELSNVIKRNTINFSQTKHESIPSSKDSITLVTQGNVHKFPRLLNLVQRWDGPISCSMYISSLEELSSWNDFVKSQVNNTAFHNHVSLHLIFESITNADDAEEQKHPKKIFYPINILRNLALRNAKRDSDFVFLNDIDLMPPVHSHSSILSFMKQQDHNDPKNNKTFWVLPAFERFSDDPYDINVNDLSLIPGDKPSLLQLLKSEKVAPFHSFDPSEHGHTNFARWYDATSTYEVEYGYKFEPYGIAKSDDLHEFYYSFRGFNRNKSSFFLEAHLRGYTFKVLPNHFVVHMNHDFNDNRNSFEDGNSDVIYTQFQSYLQGRYGFHSSLTDEKELIKTSFRFRDTDTQSTQYPCHYLMNRNKEFGIIPHFNKQQKQNFLNRWLPLTTENKFDISIVTMMHPSPEMFKRLEKMAINWSGHISVAVFIDSNSDKTRSKTKKKIRQFQLKNQQLLGTRCSFHLVTDLVENRGSDVNVFPRNVLRNVAMNNAMTDYVLVLDIDLVPSINAHDLLKRHLQTLETKNQVNNDASQKYALVVPAFEKSSKYGKEFKDIASTKEELLQMIQEVQKSYKMFLNSTKVQAHNATNYEKWYASKESEMYEVNYEVDYEPYVVVHKDSQLPPFWEHFSGFGRNKLTFIEELFISGYKFFVASDSFVVHKNHKSYGLRKLRPFVVEEYIWRFQTYIGERYGHRLQNMNELSKWGEKTYKKWEDLNDDAKQGEISWSKMAELSDRRDNDFDKCMDIVKSKQ